MQLYHGTGSIPVLKLTVFLLRWRMRCFRGINSLPQLCHHLSVGKSLLATSGLFLHECELIEEFSLSFKSLVVRDAHYDKIAFAIRRKVDWFVLLVTEIRDFTGLVA